MVNASRATGMCTGGATTFYRTALDRIGSTTFRIRLSARSARITPTARSPRMRSSITFTGVLHAPGYRERFANDLSKELPRIPFATDFHAFADAGRALAALHLGYETCQEFPLDLAYSQPGDPRPEHYRMSKRAMRYADDEKTVLIVNDHIRLGGIPAAAHRYQVNGRTPLEWVIDRYKLTQDKDSGIVNDPNSWFDDPRDLIAAIQRIVHVSVETVRIVSGLPDPFEEVEEAGV